MITSEPEILELPDQKDKLEQPETSVPSLQLLKPVSIISSIYKWNPTGWKVIINLPLTSDNRSAIFWLQANPYIPHIANDLVWLHKSTAVNCGPVRMHNAFQTLRHDTQNVHNPVEFMDRKTEPIRLIQYDLPPLLSEITRGNRRWRGDLEYRFRVASNFGSQGICAFTIAHNVPPMMAYAPGMTTVAKAFTYQDIRRPFPKRDTSYLPAFANSYVYTDMAMERHAVVRVPYIKPYGFDDFYATASSVLSFVPKGVAHAKTAGYCIFLDNQPTVHSYIGLALRGVLPTNSNTNRIEIEIDYRACENFEFGGENVYPGSIPGQTVIEQSDSPAITYRPETLTFPSTLQTISGLADSIFKSDGFTGFVRDTP